VAPSRYSINDERLAFVVANLVDAGMVQDGSNAGFAAETFQRLRVLGDVRGQEFEGHEAAQFSVFGLIDDAHSATAQLFQNSARWFGRS
jgi:hypothetical protein